MSLTDWGVILALGHYHAHRCGAGPRRWPQGEGKEEEEEEDEEETEIESSASRDQPGARCHPQCPLTSGCQPAAGSWGHDCRWPGNTAAILPAAICHRHSVRVASARRDPHMWGHPPSHGGTQCHICHQMPPDPKCHPQCYGDNVMAAGGASTHVTHSHGDTHPCLQPPGDILLPDSTRSWCHLTWGEHGSTRGGIYPW